MFADNVQYVLDVFVGLVIFAALLRFWLQAVRAPYRNPVSEFANALTDWAVRPMRRVIPGFRGLDLSSLVLAILLQFGLFLVGLLLHGISLTADFAGLIFQSLVVGTALQLLRDALYILTGAVLIQAIMSWISPYNDMAPVLEAVSGPFLRPLRRVIPPAGPVDLSSLVLLVICQIALRTI